MEYITFYIHNQKFQTLKHKLSRAFHKDLSSFEDL